MFTTTLQYFNFSRPIKAWRFLFLQQKFTGKSGQSARHPEATLYSANVHNVLQAKRVLDSIFIAW